VRWLMGIAAWIVGAVGLYRHLRDELRKRNEDVRGSLTSNVSPISLIVLAVAGPGAITLLLVAGLHY
jgi:hypothetical protein